MDTGRPKSGTWTESDLSGRQLAGYRLLRRLGKGAMAEVYLAEQLSLSRQVAIKVLRSSLATDATYVERFSQEARAAAQLVHANIVQIHEVGCADGVHFIAQEYVQGLSLAELLIRRGPPELPRALVIIRQVAAALAKAAEHGIVHRDIKPENIMLAASGEVKVADFGLARLYREDGSGSNLTQVGITMGTPLYMSPEQVEGRSLDSRSDIYSLGVTSYQLFAGEPPFRGETPLSIAVQHLKNPPPRLENLRPDLPAAVARIVHRMLAKNPADRHATPRQLLHELRAVSIELFADDPGAEFDDVGSDSLSGYVEARRQATQRLGAAMKTSAMPAYRRTKPWLVAFALAGCVLAGVGVAWLSRSQPLIVPMPVDDEAVPMQNTAAVQYIYASMLNTEAGWKGVPKYFPDDKTYTRLAREHLALAYLQQYDYETALAIFGEFAGMNDVERQSRAFGLAGQAIVLNRQGKTDESLAKLAELLPLRNHLTGEMQSLMQVFMRANRRTIPDVPQRQQWQRWLNESGPPQAPRPPLSTGAKVSTPG